MKIIGLLLSALAVVTALTNDPVINKFNDGRLQFQQIQVPEGGPHLEASDLTRTSKYNPDVQNVYHLFTRQNPSVSQPLVLNGSDALANSNFDASKRTIVLIHGWLETVSGELSKKLVPAFLEAEDVNVIVVDWDRGSNTLIYPLAVINTPISGRSVARFITWLNFAASTDVGSYHIVGHSLGGHQAGIVGRNLGGEVPYITALDPALPGWSSNEERFTSTDGVYTEVIHTNAGALGYVTPLGDVDFYPNGGKAMPGCLSKVCNHYRSIFYMAESVRRGGFTGTSCLSWVAAMTGTCFGEDSLNMGGLQPKNGTTGIFYLRTRAFPPFSRD